MRKQTCWRVVVPLLIAALAGALAGCGSEPAAPPPGTTPGVRGAEGRGGAGRGPVGMSSQQQLARLGVIGRPSQTDPKGLLVTGFVPSSEPSPLAVLGVEEGDVIVSCNGQRQQMGARLVAALEGLQSRGEPITLEVVRDGQRLTLERAEKLPGADTSESSD